MRPLIVSPKSGSAKGRKADRFRRRLGRGREQVSHRTVAQCLGEVDASDPLGSVEIGQRPRHLDRMQFRDVVLDHVDEVAGLADLHGRIAILIECCEESGSYDLPPYLEALAPRIGKPELVIALDSGCGNYEQLWGTTSLRGLVNGVLTVEVLTEGVHSGDASGVVPSSFRAARLLLERLLDHAKATAQFGVYYGKGRDTYDVRGRVAHESLFNPVNGWVEFPSV